MKTLLQIGGILQLAILSASALVPRVLDWRKNLAALHPFLRRLFWVYGIFIVYVVISFAVLTLCNVDAMVAGDAVAVSLCAVIAGFWAARLIVQFAVFDPAPFLTNRLLALGYHALTVAFAILVTIYGWAAIRPFFHFST